MPAFQMLKMSKEEFDRLMETSPSITESIIKRFNTTFSGGSVRLGKELTEKQQAFQSMYKPEICDTLETTANFVYKESQQDIDKTRTKSIVEVVKREQETRKKSAIVSDFINNFNNEFKRQPTIDEINDNLHNRVDDNTIKMVVSNNNV